MNLNKLYFEWLIEKIKDRKHFGKKQYTKLLQKLYLTPFYYTVEMDENRIGNAIEKRWIFAREMHIVPATEPLFFESPCSVLEVILDLACNIENYLLNSEISKNRVPEWFWMMITNLGLNGMDDKHYDSIEADAVLRTWMNREYERTGRGSLFYIASTALDEKMDMREYELWYQMNIFLNEYTSCYI